MKKVLYNLFVVLASLFVGNVCSMDHDAPEGAAQEIRQPRRLVLPGAQNYLILPAIVAPVGHLQVGRLQGRMAERRYRRNQSEQAYLQKLGI